MSQPNVLVTRPIMDAPLARLRERCDVTVHENEFGIPRDELLEVVQGRDALITMLTEKVDAELLSAAGPQLKIVANHAVGFDNVNVADCTLAASSIARTGIRLRLAIFTPVHLRWIPANSPCSFTTTRRAVRRATRWH